MRAFVIAFFILISLQWFEKSTALSFFNASTLKQQTTHLNIEGMVNVDGKPSAAIIEIHSTLKNHSTIERITSNATTGIFKTSLKPDDEYELVVKVNKLPQQILIVNGRHLDSNKTLNVFVDFTSAAYDHKLENLKKEIDEKVKSDMQMSAFEKKYGKLKKDKLVYKIQVGAFKFYENFNYTNVIELPKIIRKTDTDYITRFTIGHYNTYEEAAKMLKKVKESNLKEAFIVAYYNGERKLLHQLISEKILH